MREEERGRMGADPLAGLDAERLAPLLRRGPGRPEPEVSDARDAAPEDAPAIQIAELEAGETAEPVEPEPPEPEASRRTPPTLEARSPVEVDEPLPFPAALPWESLDAAGAIAEARGHIDRGLHDQAIALLQEARENDADSVEVAVALGHALSLAGAFEAAEAELQRALRLRPDQPDALCELGIVLAKKGLYELAIAQLSRALELDAAQGRVHFYLGFCHNQQDRLDQAAQAFERAIEADPRDDRAYYHLGIIWDRKGRTERAREMYRRASAVRKAARG